MVIGGWVGVLTPTPLSVSTLCCLCELRAMRVFCDACVAIRNGQWLRALPCCARGAFLACASRFCRTFAEKHTHTDTDCVTEEKKDCVFCIYYTKNERTAPKKQLICFELERASEKKLAFDADERSNNDLLIGLEALSLCLRVYIHT